MFYLNLHQNAKKTKWGSSKFKGILPPYSLLPPILPDCLHGLLPAPFLLC